MKKILLFTLSLFVWSCEKDKDNNDSPSYSACEFGGEQALVSSFPFSDNGSTENLDNNFYDENEDEWGYFEEYADYYYDYYGEEWDMQPPTGADYAYHFTIDSLGNSINVAIDLCGSWENYEYDTYLYLFEFDADSCDYVNLIDQNDDSYFDENDEGNYLPSCDNHDELDSYISRSLSPGDYYAVVGGYFGLEGDYDISITTQDSTDTFSFVNSDIKSKKVRVKNNKLKELIKIINKNK